MSVRIVDGGVILVSTDSYDNIYLKPGTITGFSGPSIIGNFEIYTNDNRVIKVRPKKDDIDTVKYMLDVVLKTPPHNTEMVKWVSDVRSHLEADLAYMNQRIDMLYEHTQNAIHQEQSPSISDCSTELESVKVAPVQVNDSMASLYMSQLFIILLAVIVFQCIYMMNMY